ncbi:MAG: hypothetical protein ACOC7K_01105, partial [bacterium]
RSAVLQAEIWVFWRESGYLDSQFFRTSTNWESSDATSWARIVAPIATTRIIDTASGIITINFVVGIIVAIAGICGVRAAGVSQRRK